jgi:glutathione-regulated potassium-efflux system protein KefB
MEAFPQAAIFVRTFDRRQLLALRPLGTHYVARELFESAVAMGREALALFCFDAEEVDRVEAEYRRRDAERLDIQESSGDLLALKERMFGPRNQIPDRETG